MKIEKNFKIFQIILQFSGGGIPASSPRSLYNPVIQSGFINPCRFERLIIMFELYIIYTYI